MMVYEEKSYTAENVHVCTRSLWKKMQNILFNTKATLSKMDASFGTTLYIRKRWPNLSVFVHSSILSLDTLSYDLQNKHITVFLLLW